MKLDVGGLASWRVGEWADIRRGEQRAGDEE